MLRAGGSRVNPASFRSPELQLRVAEAEKCLISKCVQFSKEALMARRFLILAALAGALSVALGAFAAHGLKPRLDAHLLANWETGVRYQLPPAGEPAG